MPRQVTSPEALLDTAMALVQAHGPTGITIDAVAKSAGVSKGAVLHHFRTKTDLMLGLIRRFAGRIHTSVQERLQRDSQPGALIRAMLDVSLPRPGAGPSNDVDRFMQALLAAAVHDPALLEPMREIGHAFREQMLADEERGLSDLLIMLARDGMLLWQMCGFLDPAEPLAIRLITELETRAAASGKAQR